MIDIKILRDDDRSKSIEVPRGTLVKFRDVGVQVNCNLNEPEFGEQPYVTVSTDELDTRFDYKGGCPIIAVHLDDAVLFDDEGRGDITDKARVATAYAAALVTFRDLCDDVPLDFSNEYVRGGVNLLADLYGIVERDTGERMDDILADLRRIPMFADRRNLAQYGVKPYVRDPA